jgi:hypothetical protein
MDLLAEETASDHRVEDLLDQRLRAPELTADRPAQPCASKNGSDHRWAAHATKRHPHSLEIDVFWVTS